MATLGNSEFNWKAPYLEQEYIRWNNIVKESFEVNDKKEKY